MNITENLSIKTTRTLAQLRRSLQPEVNVSFKLSQDTDVLQMLKSANRSENAKVTELLEPFLVELDTKKRGVLADHGITGSPSPDDPESASTTSSAVRASDATSRRFPFYRRQQATD